MKPKRRRLRWPLLYGAALVLFTGYVLLDTFVIPRSYAAVQNGAVTQTQEETQTAGLSAQDGAENSSKHHHSRPSDTTTSATADSDDTTSDDTTSDDTTSDTGAVQGTATDTSYQGDGVSITITTTHYNDTTIYVADVVVEDPTDLMTALASDTYGKNVTQTTSAIAQAHGAVLAINGDYYGSQNSGYVIRNGTLYRSASAGDNQEDLVIYTDGSFAVIREGSVSAQDLLDQGAWQVLSFGPGLVEEGSIAVSANDEVDKARASNPRTAIGEISAGHYVLVVADGRTSESAGLSLYQLAEFMEGLGCTTAYNLDGGGSSTMYFNGQVINQPTSNGSSIKERSVSDIVYLGF